MSYRQNDGSFVGMGHSPTNTYQRILGATVALTDTFVRQVKHTGSAAGDKYADGGGMYLFVNRTGKYWRMNYLLAGSRKRWHLVFMVLSVWLPLGGAGMKPASCLLMVSTRAMQSGRTKKRKSWPP
jgi:hypothetical protein